MKKIYLLLVGVVLLAACGPNREKQLKAIEEREQTLSTLVIIDENSDLEEMLMLYRTFANDFPNDSLAPVFLLRAADLSISMGEQEQAVELLDNIINLYPGFEDFREPRHGNNPFFPGTPGGYYPGHQTGKPGTAGGILPGHPVSKPRRFHGAAGALGHARLR